MTDGNGKDGRGRGSCGTCHWSHRDALMKDAPMFCRRHPPTAYFMGMAPTRIAGQLTPMTGASFPPIQAQMWCGEFEPRVMQQLVDMGKLLNDETAPN